MNVLLDDAGASAVGGRVLYNLLDLIELFRNLDSLTLIGIFTGFDDPDVLWW